VIIKRGILIERILLREGAVMKQILVKDVKLREIVPEKKRILDSGAKDINEYVRHKERVMGNNEFVDKLLSTPISNVDEFAELDVEKIAKIIAEDATGFKWNLLTDEQRESFIELAKAIASTKGIMKWRLEEKNEQVCPDCGGKVTDDGYSIDPDKCCGTCKMD